MRDSGVKILGVIVLLIIAFILVSCVNDSNSKKINDKVHNIGGEVLDIDVKSRFSDSPFHFIAKNDQLYRFTYILHGEKKVGWYLSSLLDDWVLDYKED